MDAGRVTALSLLDLSASFDTIDHTILLSRFDDWFGITGKALSWLRSHKTGRFQKMKLGDCLSSTANLTFGVPRESVLVSRLVTVYTTALSSMISGQPIPHHVYANDSQLYVSFASGNSSAGLNGQSYSYSCFYHMRDPRHVRRYLDLDCTKLLATVLVSSHLNYCNSLLSGIAYTNLTKLQCVQNQLALVVANSPPFTHSLPMLRALHRLLVRFRILFKISLLTCKTLRENCLFIFTP